MTEQETINSETQKALAMQDAKFAMFMEELKQQREDIRRLHERQDKMQEKHDTDMKKLQEKHDSDMHEMNQRFYQKFDEMDKKMDSKFDKLSDQIHTMTIAAVVGFGAIAVAIGGLVVAAIK